MVLERSALAKTARNEEIVQRVRQGRGSVSLQDLAVEYNLTRSRIQRIVGDAGISMRAIKRQDRQPVRMSCGQCGIEYVKGTYREHCKAAGHRRLTPPGEKVERNAEVVRLYDVEKYNTSEIAKYFDVPQPVITRILHRAGIRAQGRRPAKGGLPPKGGLAYDGDRRNGIN